MRAGNATRAPLADTVGTVTETAATLPARMPTCEPCARYPDWKPCRPGKPAAGEAAQPRTPDCTPDHHRSPMDRPGARRPGI
jgi:hypothetical protein